MCGRHKTIWPQTTSQTTIPAISTSENRLRCKNTTFSPRWHITITWQKIKEVRTMVTGVFFTMREQWIAQCWWRWVLQLWQTQDTLQKVQQFLDYAATHPQMQYSNIQGQRYETGYWLCIWMLRILMKQKHIWEQVGSTSYHKQAPIIRQTTMEQYCEHIQSHQSSNVLSSKSQTWSFIHQCQNSSDILNHGQCQFTDRQLYSIWSNQQ